MPNKITTIEDLAEMIQRTMASKEDVHAVKQDINEVKQIQKDMLEELNATHADVRYLKSSVDLLTRNEAERDSLVQDLTARVHRLEQKAGLVN